MAERHEELKKLYDDTGGPGAAAFRTLVLKRGLQITSEEARAFVRTQAAGQVFQGRIKSDGKVTAARENSVWQVDLIDYSKRNLTGDRYILTAVDVFSRKPAVEAIPNKQPSTVLEAFQKIVRRRGRGGTTLIKSPRIMDKNSETYSGGISTPSGRCMQLKMCLR